jgi:hypothetical protein
MADATRDAGKGFSVGAPGCDLLEKVLVPALGAGPVVGAVGILLAVLVGALSGTRSREN